jgi:hypothetical protein
MYKHIDEAIADLSNARTGWVTRRDAAEHLGRTAREALLALEAHVEDPDVDIRAAVARALETVSIPKGQPVPSQQYSLEDLMTRCASPGRREVQQEEEGYAVTVSLREERTQKVLVAPVTHDNGKQLLRIQTWCGQGSDELYPWLLQSNGKLVHCAFALVPEAEGERVALVQNVPMEQATPEGVKEAVKEIAFYGDWLEKKISGRDDF